MKKTNLYEEEKRIKESSEIVVIAQGCEYVERAKKLADELGLDFLEEAEEKESIKGYGSFEEAKSIEVDDSIEDEEDFGKYKKNRKTSRYEGLALWIGEDGLKLAKGNQSLRGDFSKMAKRIKQGTVYSEMLVKASKIKSSNNIEKKEYIAIDATAGLGEDAILLAAAGFRVKMYERNSVIAALLEDAMERAGKIEILEPVIERMELMKEDSIDALKGGKIKADVVVLDPMFPERQKSALIKKKFQLLQQLEAPCDNENELLEAAIAANPTKIVIKRPLKGPLLGNMKVDYSVKGKAIRYDVMQRGMSFGN